MAIKQAPQNRDAAQRVTITRREAGVTVEKKTELPEKPDQPKVAKATDKTEESGT